MPDYKNGKIYTIRCNSNTEFIYIGSTCQLLARRWQDHKKDCKKRDSKIYTTMRENGGIENFYIELYEPAPFDVSWIVGSGSGTYNNSDNCTISHAAFRN